MRSDRVKTWFRNRQMVSRGFRDFSMRATAAWKAAYMRLHARTRLDLGCMMDKVYYLERRKTLGVESRFGAVRRLGINFQHTTSRGDWVRTWGVLPQGVRPDRPSGVLGSMRSEEHTSELQSQSNLV